jgi:putative NADH-flavin reductase
MNVLVFGASGRTGRELVKQGLAQGHTVTAFVRHPAKFDIEHPHLKVVQGDAADRISVERAVKGQDAVLCALGAANLLKRDQAVVVGVHNIIMAMEWMGVRHLIYLSADTVRDSHDQLNALRKVFVPLLFHNSAEDHELNESMIKQSHVDWIIVRPPMLTNGERTGTYRSGERLRARSIIPHFSRADLAEFMLKQLTDDTFLHKTPEVMYSPPNCGLLGRAGTTISHDGRS